MGGIVLQIPHVSILRMTQIKPSHPEDSDPSTMGRGGGEFHEDCQEGQRDVQLCVSAWNLF